MNRLTSSTKQELACPQCGKVHMCERYSVINVTEKPELKEKVLKNQIFVFTCEECGLTAPLTYESVYVDSKKQMIIYLAPEMNANVEASMKMWEQVDAKHRRVVDNINDLKEKILIADRLLDDRIVEFMKIENVQQLKDQMQDDNLMNILFDTDGTNFYFLVFFEKKGIGRIPIAPDYYRACEGRYASKLSKKRSRHFTKIDFEWAGNILMERN